MSDSRLEKVVTAEKRPSSRTTRAACVVGVGVPLGVLSQAAAAEAQEITNVERLGPASFELEITMPDVGVDQVTVSNLVESELVGSYDPAGADFGWTVLDETAQSAELNDPYDSFAQDQPSYGSSEFWDGGFKTAPTVLINGEFQQDYNYKPSKEARIFERPDYWLSVGQGDSYRDGPQAKDGFVAVLPRRSDVGQIVVLRTSFVHDFEPAPELVGPMDFMTFTDEMGYARQGQVPKIRIERPPSALEISFFADEDAVVPAEFYNDAGVDLATAEKVELQTSVGILRHRAGVFVMTGGSERAVDRATDHQLWAGPFPESEIFPE